jgi:hypothetical protein
MLASGEWPAKKSAAWAPVLAATSACHSTLPAADLRCSVWCGHYLGRLLGRFAAAGRQQGVSDWR